MNLPGGTLNGSPATGAPHPEPSPVGEGAGRMGTVKERGAPMKDAPTSRRRRRLRGGEPGADDGEHDQLRPKKTAIMAKTAR